MIYYKKHEKDKENVTNYVYRLPKTNSALKGKGSQKHNLFILIKW